MQVTKYTNIQFVPYKIISYLAEHNQRLFKALYYNTSDALSRPDLTLQQIINMIYVDEGIESDKHIFLKPLIGDEMTDSTTQLRVYKYGMTPNDSMVSTINYRFDVITGSKISIIYDNGIPCSRLDVIEAELLDSLNGLDLFGTGKFQFNRDLSTSDKQILTLSNSKNFFGSLMILSVRWVNIDNCGDCCG